MAKKKQQICSICGVRPATSKDHIPFEGIFPDPKPINLITVPACDECNRSTSLDEEYFRAVITPALHNNNLATQLVVQKIIKRFRKKPALLQAIMRNSRRVDVHSEGGIYLCTLPAIRCDPNRIQTVIAKIIRGLFWYETKTVLGVDYRVTRFILNPNFDEKIKYGIVSLPLKRVGDGKVFSYRYLLDNEDKRVGCWWLMFFDATLFMSLTEPNTNEDTK